jgi:hypothetical protein
LPPGPKWEETWLRRCWAIDRTKGGKGGFKDTAGADLLAGVFKAVLNKSGVDPSSQRYP